MLNQTVRLDLLSFSAIIANWPENTAAHQRARLLEAMKVRGGVTTLEAVRFLDIVDSRPRIVELRKEGYRIKTLWVRQPSESGRMHHVGMYALDIGHAFEANSRRSTSTLNGAGRQMTLALQL
ncbi:helix-turn-helix domain-containing protein [Caballeronia sp. LZ008]|uniref:helix-turn-helix domain-containing protein n=1 Tax=unclassified Caballeronia TaxID=2646786 RepID=UPI0020285B69|nr:MULTISPECIES: helix-turn-helix domain-containing protein [unclassified Caballeronia]MDR5794260.1 helix-turn-helix domain-containing protein [Caballeronia sp. LZ008]